MNIFDFINATISLYINLSWISFPLTIYFALEINKYAAGQPYIFVELYRKFKEGKNKMKEWQTKLINILAICIAVTIVICGYLIFF